MNNMNKLEIIVDKSVEFAPNLSSASSSSSSPSPFPSPPLLVGVKHFYSPTLNSSPSLHSSQIVIYGHNLQSAISQVLQPYGVDTLSAAQVIHFPCSRVFPSGQDVQISLLKPQVAH